MQTTVSSGGMPMGHAIAGKKRLSLMKTLLAFELYESLVSRVKAAKFTDENKDAILTELTCEYDYKDGNLILAATPLRRQPSVVHTGDWIAQEIVFGTYFPVKDHVFRKKYRKL